MTETEKRELAESISEVAVESVRYKLTDGKWQALDIWYRPHTDAHPGAKEWEGPEVVELCQSCADAVEAAVREWLGIQMHG